jgi:predicted metalloprotease with PDZ domain
MVWARLQQPGSRLRTGGFGKPIHDLLAALLLLSSFGASGRKGAARAYARALGAAAVRPVTYQLDLREPASHLVHVTMMVPDAAPATLIQFPAWNALYQIRDFIRGVQKLRAECGGRPVELRHPGESVDVDLNTWRSGSEPCPALAVHYDIYLNSEPPYGSVLNQEHAFFNFAMLLFYLPQQRERAARVKFVLPAGWKLATLLEDSETPGEYQAPNYDALADSPAEAGTFQEYSYVDGGATYRVIVHADPSDYAPDRLLKSLQRITATETALMHGAPFSRYTFIFHFPRGPAGGGMEHKYGTAISVRAGGLRSHLEPVEGVAAHEFFHLWNVKRIRPQGLEPIDYVRGNDTSDLWFSEGVTSSYGELALVRSGLKSRAEFYSGVAQEIKSLETRPAREFQSVEESGREAWLEKYPDYFRANRSISYYNKGELVGFLLDLGMRHATHDRSSLDDLMRTLNVEFARRGRLFTDADLEAVIARLAPEFTARTDFFRNYIRGTAELDYSTYLGYAGLRLSTVNQEKAALGFLALRSFEGPALVESVEPGSEAEQAGLKPGDILLKMNGRPLEGLPEDELEFVKPGKEVRFTARRGGQTVELRFHLGRKQETAYLVQEERGATPDELAVRESWLTGGPGH